MPRVIDCGSQYAKTGEVLAWTRKLGELKRKLLIPEDKLKVARSIDCMTAPRVVVSYCEKCECYHAHPIHCQSRFFCPECTRKLSRASYQKYKHLLKLAQENQLYFLTVTIKNPYHISNDLIKLVKAIFYKLRRPKGSPLHRGGIGKLEIPLSKEGDTWNVHLHAIFISDRDDIQNLYYSIKKEWKKHTKKYMGEESYIVDLKRADTGSLRELVKYVVKHETGKEIISDRDRYLEFVQALRRVRVIWTWGECQGINYKQPFVCTLCQGPVYFYDFNQSDNILNAFARARDGPIELD